MMKISQFLKENRGRVTDSSEIHKATGVPIHKVRQFLDVENGGMVGYIEVGMTGHNLYYIK